MELSIRSAGILLMSLALLHAGFPRHFNWKKELAGLSLINRQMMIVHSFFIALVVFMMGFFAFSNPEELTGTPLGRKLALAMGIFWSLRLLIQIFGYSPELWRGKKFETGIHIFFTLLWTGLSILFWTIGLTEHS